MGVNLAASALKPFDRRQNVKEQPPLAWKLIAQAAGFCKLWVGFYGNGGIVYVAPTVLLEKGIGCYKYAAPDGAWKKVFGVFYKHGAPRGPLRLSGLTL